MPNPPKEKVIRVTVEFHMSDRKIWRSRVREGYELGVDMLIQALREALPEGAVLETNSWLEWFYLYERSHQKIDQTEEDGEPVKTEAVAVNINAITVAPPTNGE
jgi:hypothetical protein